MKDLRTTKVRQTADFLPMTRSHRNMIYTQPVVLKRLIVTCRFARLANSLRFLFGP
jgi:hypothetical protein